MSENPSQPTGAGLEWAAIGTKTEPSAPKKATGWVNAEAPPFDFFNWRWDAEDQWVTYLNEIAGRQFTTALGPNGACGLGVLDAGTKVRLLRDAPETHVFASTSKGIPQNTNYEIFAVDSDCRLMIYAEADTLGDGNIIAYNTEPGTLGSQEWIYNLAEGFIGDVRSDGWTVAVTGSAAATVAGTNGLTMLAQEDGSLIATAEAGVNIYAAYPDSIGALGGTGRQAWYLPWTGATGNPIKRWEGNGPSTAIAAATTGFYVWDICHSAEAVIDVRGDGGDDWYVYVHPKNSAGVALSSSFRLTAQSSGVGHGASGVGGKVCTDGRMVFALIGRRAAPDKPVVYAFPLSLVEPFDNVAPVWSAQVGTVSEPLSMPSGCRIECDDRYVYVTAVNDFIILDKFGGQMQRRVTYPGASSNRAPHALGVDVERVWLGGSETAGISGYLGMDSFSTARYSSDWRLVQVDPAAANPERFRLWRKYLQPIKGGYDNK